MEGIALGLGELDKPPAWIKHLNQIEPVFAVDNSSDSETSTIRIYGPIGQWWGRGISVPKFAAMLDKATGKRVLVRINSPGGVASDGMAIRNLCVQDGRVDTQVDGVAASAAGIIFLGGNKRLMPKTGANVMLHVSRSFVMAFGTAKEIRSKVDVRCRGLEAIDEEFKAIMAEVTGMSPEKAVADLEKDTWYSPKAALKAGIATDYVEPPKSRKETPTAYFDLMDAWGYEGVDSVRRDFVGADVSRMETKGLLPEMGAAVLGYYSDAFERLKEKIERL